MKIVALVLTILAATQAFAEATMPPRSWVDAGAAVPVAAEGRVLPLDTWSAVVYGRLSGRDRAPEALEWLLTALVFPERLADQPFLLVNDPLVAAGSGVVLDGRGRYSPRTLAPLLPQAPGWVRDFAGDPSPGGQERYRLGQALVLYHSLEATFGTEGPDAKRSPFKALNLAAGGLNPAEALDSSLDTAERDRLALLLFGVQESRAGRWDQASEAFRLLAVPASLGEVVYNRVPWAGITAVLGLLGLATAWMGRRRPGRWEALAPGAAWLVVTVWIAVRMVLSGRPPVTNLAGTFLAVSWLTLGAALVLSLRPKQRSAALLALAAGSLLPLLSLAVQGGSDPFAPLQAVLNTNFWLSVHVMTIIAGYAATFAAGLIGHGYLAASLSRKGGGQLAVWWRNLQIVLGTALALTLAGTLLGGVWADQSWGRFWGWDPKENGALLILLWLALTLHLKPAGFTTEWGTALAAAFLVPVLLFSWLGVNLLGVGFHSYGAAPGKVLLFLGLVAADLLVLAWLTLRRVLR